MSGTAPYSEVSNDLQMGFQENSVLTTLNLCVLDVKNVTLTIEDKYLKV